MHNRLGVSSDMVPMIDYDARTTECRLLFPSFERELAKKLGVDIAVIKTEKGYHLIPLMVLYPKGRMVAELSALKAYIENLIRKGITPRILPGEVDAYIDALTSIENPQLMFDDFYRWLQKEFDVYITYRCIDMAHIDATLRRRYTTLRISGKECKPYDIEFLHFMTPEGIPISIEIFIYLNVYKPNYRCIDIKHVIRLVHNIVRVKYPWVRREAHERLMRYLVPTLT